MVCDCVCVGGGAHGGRTVSREWFHDDEAWGGVRGPVSHLNGGGTRMCPHSMQGAQCMHGAHSMQGAQSMHGAAREAGQEQRACMALHLVCTDVSRVAVLAHR